MRITKITYQKAFIVGPYLQEKIGAEAELEPGDREDQSFTALKRTVEHWNEMSNQQLDGSDLPPHLATQITWVPTPEINLQHEKLEIEIDNCTTLPDLIKWKSDHDVLPGKILTHYSKRLKELTP